MYGSDFPLMNTGLCRPLFHLFTIGPVQWFKLQRMKNPWGRDVKLKQALGVPAHVFCPPAGLLRMETD